MIDGIAGDAFSAQVLPPIYIGDTAGNEEKIIAASRERYASSKEEVEDKISRWAGVMPAGGFQTVNKPSMQQFVSSQAQPVQQKPQFSNPAPAQQFQKPLPASEPVPVQTQQIIEPTAPIKAREPIQVAVAQETVQQAQPAFRQVQMEEADLVEYAQPEPPKPMFEAICDMCNESIQVPFQPDGKRPTFCKDCLKDYQRMTAKEKLNQERKIQRQQEDAQSQSIETAHSSVQKSEPLPVSHPQGVARPQSNYQPAPRMQQVTYNAPSHSQRVASKPLAQQPERRVEHKAYAPQDRPMSLSQMQHIAPKKFKPRQRPNVNLDEVRNLINDTKSN
jgi:CxxC-x17-CxxC domain-containing protein